MAFHFINFNLVQGAFAYGDFSIEFPGGVLYSLSVDELTTFGETEAGGGGLC